MIEEYMQAYVPGFDLTIILKDTYVDGKYDGEVVLKSTEITGMYYGSPTEELMLEYKNKGIKAEFDIPIEK